MTTVIWTSSVKSETDVMNAMWFSNFSKSTFGFTHVKFFGYKVQDGKWCLDDDRKQAVTDTPMPTDLKKTQTCLGVGIYFLVSLYRTMQPSQPIYMT